MNILIMQGFVRNLIYANFQFPNKKFSRVRFFHLNMLKEYMEDIVMPSSDLNLDRIKRALRKQFDEDQNFTIDLKGVRTISPSFAYQCFGRLYDDKKDLEKLIDRINVLKGVFAPFKFNKVLAVSSSDFLDFIENLGFSGFSGFFVIIPKSFDHNA